MNKKGWRYSCDNMMAQIHPGAIVATAYRFKRITSDALDQAIVDLKSRLYDLKVLMI